MSNNKLQTLKGFRDFLPEEAEKRQYALSIIRDTFELFDFEPLETPSLEYKELLSGKYGEEGNKQMYSFTDNGGREVALRYDQTVPTARVLATYVNSGITLPFRRFQIQPSWRADKPQSGRFREFLQCDADIYGSVSFLADAEILSLGGKIYKNLGFDKAYKIFINDRQHLFKLMNEASIPENLRLIVLSIIDKLDRKSEEEVANELLEAGLEKETVEHLFHHLEETLPNENIKNVIEQAEFLGVDKNTINFQARLARGLDYYTSTIFEIKIEGYEGGSVCGGGRYDNLIKELSGTDIPAVGFGLGFDRTVAAMEQFDLFPKKREGVRVLITVFGANLSKLSAIAANYIRKKGIRCQLYPREDTDIAKQLKYANSKKFDFAIIIGPDEAKNEKVVVKNLATGTQKTVFLTNLPAELTK